MSIKKILLPTIALGIALVPKVSTDVYAANINCNPFAKTIAEVVCMQDMNDSVKESMVLERQYELRDKRDGKKYYIAKLADGNVWMTQNLDFDIDKNATLTPEDTDIKSNWKPKESTYWVDDIVDLEPEPAPDPAKNKASEVSGVTMGEDWYNHQHSIDVGDLYWDGTIVNEILYNPVDVVTGAVPEIEIGNTATSGDRHYHLGNYYNWLAATASDDDASYLEVIEGDAEQSVCPAGWTLPSLYSNFSQGQRNVSSEKPSVADLMAAYYYDENTDTYAWKVAPAGAPLYLNFSDVSNGYVGANGTIWTSSFINRNSMVEGGYGESELTLTGSPIMGYLFYYGSDYADWGRAHVDEMLTSVRCVARSRIAVDANWVKGQTYDEEDPEEAVLLIDADIEELASITLDGELVSEGANMALAPDEEGGFTVTFAPEFLDTLEEGDHVVRATFTSGNSVYAKLTVSRSSIAVPNTGANTADAVLMKDNSNLMTAIAFTVICFGVMTVVYRATHSKFKGF